MRVAEWIALGSTLGITVFACTGTSPGADSRSPTRAAVTTRAPDASVRATASSAPAAVPEATPFRLVAVADDLQLAPLGDETYVTVGCNRGGPFASARIVGSTIELSDALTEGWGHCVFCVCNFQGWAPDHIFREAARDGADGCTTQEFRVKRGASWKPVHGPGGGYLTVSGWSKGRKLVFGQDCGRTTKIVALDANDKVIPARDLPSVGPELGGVPAFVSFPSGEAMALSEPSDAASGRLFVWRDGKTKAVTHPLPRANGEWQSASMVAFSPTDVFVAVSTGGPPYLAHFDGATWSSIAVSGPTDIEGLRPARDGGLWFIAPGRRLWHRKPSGSFDSLLLPPGFTLLDLVETAPGDVWVVSDRELHHNRPVAPAVAIVTDCPDVFQNATQPSDYDLGRCSPRFEALTR